MIDKIEEKLVKQDVFLTGGAGTGKTYLTRNLSDEYIKKGKLVLRTASTGIVASANEGITIHSALQLGICNNIKELIAFDKFREKPYLGLTTENLLRDLKSFLKRYSLIIIDEVSLLSAQTVDMIYFRLNQILGEEHIPILWVGDFFQLPPVKATTYAFQSKEWAKRVCFLELITIHRTKDAFFKNVLNKVRVGNFDREVLEFVNYCSSKKSEESSTKLFSTKQSVLHFNNLQLNNSKGKTYKHVGEVSKHNSSLQERDRDAFLKDCPAEKVLFLKENSPCLIVKNNPLNGLYNGSYVVIKQVNNRSIIVLHNNEEKEIGIEEFSKLVYKAKSKTMEATFTLHQYPLILAYALTFHKVQGMTLESVSLDCNNLFTPSLFYVGLSRAIKADKVYIENFDKSKVSASLKYIIQYYKSKGSCI